MSKRQKDAYWFENSWVPVPEYPEGNEVKYVTRCIPSPDDGRGDPDFLAALIDIETLHKNKSARYGTDEDRFDNFTRVAQSRNQDPGVYIIDRIQEKLVRIQNMQAHGDTIESEDWLDIASCALCGEAMRRKSEY